MGDPAFEVGDSATVRDAKRRVTILRGKPERPPPFEEWGAEFDAARMERTREWRSMMDSRVAMKQEDVDAPVPRQKRRRQVKRAVGRRMPDSGDANSRTGANRSTSAATADEHRGFQGAPRGAGRATSNVKGTEDNQTRSTYVSSASSMLDGQALVAKRGKVEFGTEVPPAEHDGGVDRATSASELGNGEAQNANSSQSYPPPASPETVTPLVSPVSVGGGSSTKHGGRSSRSSRSSRASHASEPRHPPVRPLAKPSADERSSPRHGPASTTPASATANGNRVQPSSRRRAAQRHGGPAPVSSRPSTAAASACSSELRAPVSPVTSRACSESLSLDESEALMQQQQRVFDAIVKTKQLQRDMAVSARLSDAKTRYVAERIGGKPRSAGKRYARRLPQQPILPRPLETFTPERRPRASAKRAQTFDRLYRDAASRDWKLMELTRLTDEELGLTFSPRLSTTRRRSNSNRTSRVSGEDRARSLYEDAKQRQERQEAALKAHLERLRAASTIAPSRPKSPRLRNTTRGSSRSSSVKSAASTQGGGDTRASQEEAKREARRQAARDAWMVQAAESGLLKRTAEFEEKRAQKIAALRAQLDEEERKEVETTRMRPSTSQHVKLKPEHLLPFTERLDRDTQRRHDKAYEVARRNNPRGRPMRPKTVAGFLRTNSGRWTSSTPAGALRYSRPNTHMEKAGTAPGRARAGSNSGQSDEFEACQWAAKIPVPAVSKRSSAEEATVPPPTAVA